MPVKLFFSNTIETLTLAFTKRIASRQRGFDRTLIIIPNPYIKKWLQMETARTNEIAMNLDFRFMHDGLWELAHSMNPDAGSPALIDQTDLQIMLYHSFDLLSNPNPNMKPLADYLRTGEAHVRPEHEKKKWQLSLRLARYFLEYELFREDMIQSWWRGALLYNSKMERAQSELYRSVFKKGGIRDAMLPNRYTLPQYWNRLSPAASAGDVRSLFIFGEPLLSPFHARMIFELGRHIDIFLYQLNPCSEFWEDVTTPREDRWQRIRSLGISPMKNGEELDEYENENALLKLWGKTGRETVKLLSRLEEAGSAEMNVTSEWLSPSADHSSQGLLGAVQDQILMRTSRLDQADALSQDCSIQVASCTEIYREVEVVYNSILYNLEKDRTLRMTDIAVMVPDMSSYGPVLRSVFSRSPKRLSYSMIDSTAAADSLFGKAITSLLDIASGSFTRTEVFELVFNRCFLEAHGMTIDDADIWLSWADALNIFHDFRRADDIRPGCNLYTWHQGLVRTRFGRIMESTLDYRHDGTFLDYNSIVPYTDLHTGDQRLIDAFNRSIELLYIKTKDLGHYFGSGDSWIGIIENLVSNFLSIPAEMPEEERVYKHLMESLEKLRPADGLKYKKKTAGYSLTFIKEFIAENLTGIPSATGSYLTGGINISAMVPHRQIPFRLIYLMGMQEGIYPGSGDASTLNLMSVKRKIGDMSRPDINRYLFLETLLSGREKLYITYVSKDLQKDQDFYPNSVTGQLIAYISKHVTHSEFSIVEIPPSGSSEQYLSIQGDAALYSDLIISNDSGAPHPVNYSASERLFLLQSAAARYTLDPSTSTAIANNLKSRIPDFTLPRPENSASADRVEINIRDLARFLTNPVESTLRWHLSLYDEDDEDITALEDEPFYSIYPYNNIFITDTLGYYALGKSISDVLAFFKDYYNHTRCMSITPDGAYGTIDHQRIASAIAERLRDDAALTVFLKARTTCRFYQNITFGSTILNMKPDMAFPPMVCPLPGNNKNIQVYLSGSLPLIWQNSETGELDTLVITNREKPSVSNIILPFLWYVSAASGLDDNLQTIIGDCTFTVHQLHLRGVTPYRYRLTRNECADYLRRLLVDFLDESRFDLLPIQILSERKKIIQPHDMNTRAGDAEKQRYRETLIRLINDDAEKDFPLFRPMKICELINAEVPPEAYDMVRDRLGPLLLPFAGEKES